MVERGERRPESRELNNRFQKKTKRSTQVQVSCRALSAVEKSGHSELDRRKILGRLMVSQNFANRKRINGIKAMNVANKTHAGHSA
jgi:hypothetical protein